MPGGRPPEVEVFTDPAVRYFFAEGPYKISLQEILAGVAHHHDYAATIAGKLMLEKDFVAVEACRAYANARTPEDFILITTFLREKLGDRR